MFQRTVNPVLLALAVLTLIALTSNAQNHPRMILTPDVLASLRDRAANRDVGWKALVGAPGGSLFPCAQLTQSTSTSVDGLPPVFPPRGPSSGVSTPGQLGSGYQGSYYYDAVHNLGLCYQVERDRNPKQAARYAVQGVKILKAMSMPFATATVVSGGFTRVLYFVDNTGPGGQALAVVNWPTPELQAGVQVRISGVLGCTAANGLRQVASTAGNSFLLSDLSGSPVVCEGAGTNYNHNFLSDSGYPIRFFLPALAIGYDWFYDELDTATKEQIWATMNAWVNEFHLLYAKNGLTPYRTRTQSNYHAGYYAAVGMAGIATRGENPQGEALYRMWRNEIHLGRDQPHFERWLGPYGGFPEAWSYLPLSVTGIGMTLLSNWTAFGDDLIGHPTQPMPWITGLMRYYIHGTTPGLTHLIERGYIPAPATTNNDPLRTSPSMFFLPYYLSKLRGDPAAPQYKQFFDDVLARFLKLPGTVPWSALWQRFLFYNSNDPSTDWRQEQPSLATLSNPAGGYGQILMRSGWDDNAVMGSFLAHPQASDYYNGKERMDKGSLLVQSGDTHLLVSPAAEAARAGNSAAHSYFHDNMGNSVIPPPQNLAYGLYYVTRPGWTSYQWPAVSKVSQRSPGASDIPPDTATVRQFTVTAAQSGLLTAPAHGLKDGDLVYFYSTSSFPTGLAAGGVYYVRDAQTDTFRVSANSGRAVCATSQDCIDVNGTWEGAVSGYGSDSAVMVTEHPTRIDRYEDQGAYVYSRGVGLETLFAYDELKPGFFPVAKWGREVLYLRPRVFVVYDRTGKRDSADDANLRYTQYLAWSLGKTPRITSGANDPMLRVEVADNGAMKGILTTVLPAQSTAAIEDLGGYGIVHQLRVAPPANTASTHWLTIVDASTTADQISTIQPLTGTNVDAVQIGNSVAVGFVVDQESNPSFSYTVGSLVKTHIIAGVVPLASYSVTKNGNTVTVHPTVRPNRIGKPLDHSLLNEGTTATAAGVLYLSTDASQALQNAASLNWREALPPAEAGKNAGRKK